MKIQIINDIHIEGVNQLMTFNDMLNHYREHKDVTYFAGDIIDMANCKKKNLPRAMQLLNLLATTNRLILGNHELDKAQAPDFLYLFNDQLLIMHGDIAMWGFEKANKFRQQPPGAGWFKRNIISKPIDALRRLWAVRPNDNLKEFIRQTKKNHPNLKYVIMGHSHPPHRVEFTEANVICCILPRGVNWVEIDV